MSDLKSKRLMLAFCGYLTIFALSSHADQKKQNTNFRIVGTTLATIQTNTNKEEERGTKTVGLLKIIPSTEFVTRQTSLLEQMKLDDPEHDYSAGIVPFSQSPGSVDLGMGEVPVLDQGAYGTCVTFSTIAAIDALLQKGDFISQQCTLQLNRVLGSDLWNGAYFSSQIIDPLKKYGVVKQGKGTAKEGKCNNEYPNIFGMITISGYKQRAQNSGENLSQINYKYYPILKLDDVKHALQNNHRITVSFGVIASEDSISVQGFDIKMNNKNMAGGLWSCQQPSHTGSYCGRPNAGHEVVIIGYDDTQNLLKIRNSWNATVGDNGDFYMSYEFFNAMIFDGTEIY